MKSTFSILLSTFILFLTQTNYSTLAFTPSTRITSSIHHQPFIKSISIPQLDTLSSTKSFHKKFTSLQSTSNDDTESAPLLTSSSIPYLLTWIFFISFAFILGPDANDDVQMVNNIVSNPISPGVNPIFYCIFDLFAIIPLVLACLIMPNAKEQRLPATPFLIAASAIGYVALGPYMTLRKSSTNPITKSELGWFTSNILENKLVNYSTLLFAILVPFSSGLIPAFLSAPPSELWQGFVDLITTSKLASASTIDLSILTIVSAVLIAEDCERRGLKNGNVVGAASLLLPVIGGAAYCALRPELEEEE